MTPAPPFASPQVAAAYARFPENARAQLLALRTMIYAVAQETEGTGQIDETLKWGQPSYATSRPKSGTPLRLGLAKDGRSALFAHCQTSVIADFQAQFGSQFTFDGNRALLLEADAPLPSAPLRLLIHSALTYHL